MKDSISLACGCVAFSLVRMLYQIDILTLKKKPEFKIPHFLKIFKYHCIGIGELLLGFSIPIYKLKLWRKFCMVKFEIWNLIFGKLKLKSLLRHPEDLCASLQVGFFKCCCKCESGHC